MTRARDLDPRPTSSGPAAEAVADPRLACELIELAYLAAPDDAAIRAARAKLYTARWRTVCRRRSMRRAGRS